MTMNTDLSFKLATGTCHVVATCGNKILAYEPTEQEWFIWTLIDGSPEWGWYLRQGRRRGATSGCRPIVKFADNLNISIQSVCDDAMTRIRRWESANTLALCNGRQPNLPHFEPAPMTRSEIATMIESSVELRNEY